MAINVDIMPVEDEQAALVLMFHHLQLAAAYFEATPDPIREIPEGFSMPAMGAWLLAMDDLYPKDDD